MDLHKLVPVLLLSVGGVLLPTRIGAQAPAETAFPKSITVSPGPKTNLFPHLMTKAEVLAALAQVQDSQDLVVKTNFAITLRAASNTTKLPWKLHTEADELWFVYKGSAKVTLAPFSLQLGVTPPGNKRPSNNKPKYTRGCYRSRAARRAGRVRTSWDTLTSPRRTP